MHYRRSRIASAIVFWILAAFSATASQDRGPLWELGTEICKSGQPSKNEKFDKLFRLDFDGRSIQESAPSRSLWMPADHCNGVQISETRSFVYLVLSKGDNRSPGSTRYYLTSPWGELLRAVQEIRLGTGTTFLAIKPSDQVQAEFEAEKKYWMARYGLRLP